ncbi:hypothetical protein RI367_001259 [Sorochytrium milnesiophthora]
MSNDDDLQLTATWSGKKLAIAVPPASTVLDLKMILFSLTNVAPVRQKLVGLVRGKLPDDATELSSLALKLGHSFIMMGTPEELTFQDPGDVQDGLLPDVANDLTGEDVVYDTKGQRTPENLKKLDVYIQKADIHVINPPRSGKKLLVMDLDFTIYDCKSAASNVMDLLRPGTHEFLEMKATELGLLTHPNYRISFVLDKTHMFSIVSRDSKGRPFKHQVKALDIVWAKFPQYYSPSNTLHIGTVVSLTATHLDKWNAHLIHVLRVDDLGRNFAMNPSNVGHVPKGLKIAAWKNAPVNRHNDTELFSLAKYILQIAVAPDLTQFEHKKWRSFDGPLPSDFNPVIGSGS